MSVELENFPTCKEVCIPAGAGNGEYPLFVADIKKRWLHLRVKLHKGLGGSVKVRKPTYNTPLTQSYYSFS